MLEQIDHVNIVVEDLESMTRFYRDRLGFKVTKQVTIRGEWIDRVVGMTGVEADVVYLDPPSGPRVELIQYRSPAGASHADLGTANTRGLRHLAFRVDDIDSTSMGLRRAGIEMISDVQDVPGDQVTYAGGVRKRLCYFRDPEGNLLELCEYRGAPAATRAQAWESSKPTSTPSSPSASASESSVASGAAKSLASPHRRRAAAARRRLYVSLTTFALLGAAGWYGYHRWIKPNLHLVIAPPPSTQPEAPAVNWMDVNNQEILERQRRYVARETPGHRAKAFVDLGALVHYAHMSGAILNPEQIVEKLGPPDLYHDLKPFRTLTYIFSGDAGTNDSYVDITFDREAKAIAFEWGKLAKSKHDAAVWKRFPTTQDTSDPKALLDLLPPLEDL